MKFSILVQIGENAHWEQCSDPAVKNPWTAAEAGKVLVEQFNASLREGEQPRVFLKSSFTLQGNYEEHDWEKLSLFTEKGGYDRMRCRNCYATGKRYGLGQFGVKVDKKSQLTCKPQN